MINWTDCKKAVRSHRRLSFSGAALLAVGAGWMAFGSTSSEHDEVKLVEMERSRLVVSVQESGTIEPVTETTIRNEVSGSSRIIYLVPEGTLVEEGKLLVELDGAILEDQLERRQLSHEKRQAAHAAAQSRLMIAKSDADSRIRKAELEVSFARMDMEKFEKIERSHLLRQAEMDILLAEETLRISQHRFENSERLAEAGFETESKLNRDRLSVTTDSAKLEKAESNQKVEQRFDLVKRYEKLSADLIESQKELMRTKREMEGRVTQAQVKLDSAEAAMEVSALALVEAREQVNLSKIYAPHSGMVVYGGSASTASRDSMIEEGAMVRNRQELITIPDTTAMKIAVKVHETVASDVQVGQDALVTLDSEPDKSYRGEVSHVALFPDRKSFWSSSQSLVYSAEITITEPVENLPPGASGKAQIILHYLEDVVTVPIDAVETIEGQPMVEVRLPGNRTETRSVEIGVNNDRRVHVLSGIDEGDIVVVRNEAG